MKLCYSQQDNSGCKCAFKKRRNKPAVSTEKKIKYIKGPQVGALNIGTLIKIEKLEELSDKEGRN